MSLGGVGHVELSEGFFGLTDCPIRLGGGKRKGIVWTGEDPR